jgi:hypothetical protein
MSDRLVLLKPYIGPKIRETIDRPSQNTNRRCDAASYRRLKLKGH